MGVDSVVPACPAGLSVNKQDFLKADFTVDNFFIEQNVKDTPLDSLRDDLGIYLKVLRSSMIELINEDYADFVNLSTNLVGLDTSIEKLKEPLNRVRKEVNIAESDIHATLDRVQNLLKEQAEIREKKESLSKLRQIWDTLEKVERMLGSEDEDIIPSDVTERIAGDINFLLFSTSKMKDAAMIQDLEPRILSVCDRLNSSLDLSLIQALQAGDTTTLGKCCRTYATIDRISSAETLVQEKVLRPALSHILTETNLENNAHGLKGVLKEALNLIPDQLSPLVEITSDDSCLDSDTSVKGFDFIVNSFWCEVWSQMKQNLNFVFSPGNPAQFFKYYSDSTYFLSEIENYLTTEDSVKKLRSHECYKDFNTSWNLPVYFQIRFQEIASSLETSLEVQGDLELAKCQDPSLEQLKLAASEHLIAAIKSCYDPNIFLRPLGDKFVKLSFQTVARYVRWVRQSISKFREGDIIIIQDLDREESQQSKTGLAKSSTSKDLQNLQVLNKGKTHRRSASDQLSQQSQDKSASVPVKPITISELVLMYCDVMTLSSIIPGLITSLTQQSLQVSLQPAVDSTAVELQGVLPDLEKCIVHHTAQQSVKLVKQVADIPRMYRRTNRETPSKPCQYINSVISNLTDFNNKHAPNCQQKVLQTWLKEMSEEVLSVYLINVTDVLTNVTKMEESLKKLKKVRERGGGGQAASQAGQNNQGKLSDDDKIRVQLYIDVTYFSRELANVGVSEAKNLEEILKVVQSAAGHLLPQV